MREHPLRNKIWMILQAISYPLIFLLCQMIVGVLGGLFSMFQATSNLVMVNQEIDESMLTEIVNQIVEKNALVISIVSGIVTIGVFIFIQRIKKQPVLESFHVKTIPMAETACAVAGGIGMYVVTAILLSVIPFPSSMVTEYETSFSDQMLANPVMNIAAFVLVAPLVEELVFRVMCGETLRKVVPVWVAILGQAVLFSLCHLVPYQMIYVLPTGIVLGFVYMWSGSILTPVLFHATYNFMGVLIGELPEEFLVGNRFLSALIVVGPIMLVIALYLMYRAREK